MIDLLVSLVVPLYNEEDNILVFFDEVSKVLLETDPKYNFEILFTDDGSRDKSAKLVSSLKPNSRINPRLVQLSRNFGKEAAVSAGLSQAKGDAVIVIDVDLQHPVEKIPEFIKAWEQGADVVVGVRDTYSQREPLKIIASKLFYRLLEGMSETKIVPHSTDFRLISREVVDQFNALSEHNRIVRGLIDWLGYEAVYVTYKEKHRLHGTPSYSYKKLVKLALTTFVQHSFFPLRIAGYLGSLISVVSGFLGLFILIEDIILNDPMSLEISGTAMLATLILFLVGLILACMGLMGLYIATIHDEATGRPVYIIRKQPRL